MYMEFNFVVGKHSMSTGKEKPIAGFLNLEEAKNYTTVKNLDYLYNGYMYIDTEEGRYILGEETKEIRDKWYSPNEKAYVFDSSKDRVVSIEDCI